MAALPVDKPQRDELAAEVLLAYHSCWQRLRYAAGPLWAALNLSMMQLKALLLLDQCGCMAVCQVADALAIGRPSASNLIEQLVQLGLVARADDVVDRRRALATLTAQGCDLLARLYEGDEAVIGAWMQHLCDDDLGALCRGLRALADAAEAATPQPEVRLYP